MNHHDHENQTSLPKDCCHPAPAADMEGSCHSHAKFDWLYYGSLAIVAAGYAAHVFGFFSFSEDIAHFNHQIFEMMNDMWWGIILSIVAVGLLSQIPRELVMTYFSSRSRGKGLVKATLAGTLFDLCNHGVLILAMKIYERGASLGQTMAFLIASPWNSFSLTLIMYTLIGGPLTFTFLILSIIMALVTGWIFEVLVERKILPANPNSFQPAQVNPQMLKFHPSWAGAQTVVRTGFAESKMILKWIFFGTILSALVGVFMSPETFANYFGNSLLGMFTTLLAATGLEVCSEGSIPLAADLVTVAKAPGNAFIFLMAGVATDLTEILAVRETTKSWKVALFLPLITIPQIILLGFLLNWDAFLSRFLSLL